MKRLFSLLYTTLFVFTATGCHAPLPTLFTGLPAQNDTYYKPFKTDIHQFRNAMNSTPVAYGDIWIRDVAPVVTDRLVKFTYAPDYLPARQSRTIDRHFTRWLNEQGFHYQQSDIILDGGNFIYNGQQTAIITTRILKDNPDYSRQGLIKQLKKLLHLETIILINPEPGDVLGHADGQVHFIQPNVLFVGDFENKAAVKKQIRKAAPDLKLVDLPSNYQAAGQYDPTIPSARGLYINMLETDTDLYLPQYGLKTDQQVAKKVARYTHKKIHLVDVKELSTLGGSVNCLTWYCPQKLLPTAIH
ncbi:peptidyl-arginine deiminase [Lactobacillus selangorensis]|uniref:Peptidyl-arginine deiminase n=1 Tax=Lactobacillus selangorensis TaxID=81857 RepID=A0A0R2FI41_9LACO|nr:agmatine deiminase family protein [Lactobacillus selangorensis]KRN28208.1 peptidyl-arginine deiminase [Lactobacillus selangorensis]KRN30916.1 peptidyl-arginine deiminase [Lactobacillus selangorensis]